MPVSERLLELAADCENAAVEQADFAVRSRMPQDAAREYASFAADLFTVAAALRARAQTKED